MKACNCVNACTRCGRCCQDCTCAPPGVIRLPAPGVGRSEHDGPPSRAGTELVPCAACNGRGLRGEAICQGCNGAGKQRV